MAKAYPDRFILNGSFDPRDGELALEYIHFMKESSTSKASSSTPPSGRATVRGWKLNDPNAYKCFELCDKLGIKNIHVHKGPTIIPLNKDAFDVHDVDYAATDFQGLNFIIEHCGLPRLDDFCWIAVQETNVYGGLAVAMPFIHAKPHYFDEVHGRTPVLARRGQAPVRVSDYAIWTPKWIVDKFMAWELPDEIKKERGVDLTHGGQEEDPRAECRQALRHRHRRQAEEEAAERNHRRRRGVAAMTMASNTCDPQRRGDLGSRLGDGDRPGA